VRNLSGTEVDTLLREGVEYALAEGLYSTVAVVDMGGHLRGLLRPERGRR
jgi:uncharacterized protein GlcG (DUF336 family)